MCAHRAYTHIHAKICIQLRASDSLYFITYMLHLSHPHLGPGKLLEAKDKDKIYLKAYRIGHISFK